MLQSMFAVATALQMPLGQLTMLLKVTIIAVYFCCFCGEMSLWLGKSLEKLHNFFLLLCGCPVY